jgi:hypothetical protein
VRIVLSLFLLISAFTLFTANGCGNSDLATEEEKIMAESVSPTPGSNMTGEYKTATFALG